MSKIEELLKNVSIEWKRLEEIGVFYGGLTGKNKYDFKEGNAKFISYKNVYLNPSVNLDLLQTVKIHDGEVQNKLEYGDIIFTGSSETLEECGLSSVIIKEINEDIYLNSFCFYLRLHNKNMLLTDFSKYLFRSQILRQQIKKTAEGVTRFNVSRQLMKKILIPIPPLSLQAEIVRILDTFTHLADGLITALTKELELRKKQYRYYLGKLLSEEHLKECAKKMGETESVRILTLADVCEISAGGDVPKHSFSEEKNDEYNIPIISNGTAKNAIYGYTSQAKITKPAVTISARGTIGYVEYRDYPYYPIVRLLSLVPKQDSKLLTKYLYYYLLQKEFLTPTAGIKQLTIPMIKEETIPLPALSIQEKIVKILDHLSSLVHNIEEGLLSEIAFRQKQYEYYREKLLNFGQKEA